MLRLFEVILQEKSKRPIVEFSTSIISTTTSTTVTTTTNTTHAIGVSYKEMHLIPY